MSRATEKYKRTKEWKLQNAKDQHRYYCYCGHAVRIYPWTKTKDGKNDGSLTCGWCGRKVFANPEKQARAIERYKREDFRIKMFKALKGGK